MFLHPVLLILFVNASIAVRFAFLGVPGSILLNESVWLVCGYDLEGDELYSVKWYKNNFEFYRFLPSDMPPAQKYNLKGIFVDLSHSNETHVLLYKTDLNTEGMYLCEVSTEAPSFRTVKAEKELRVYVIPKADPVIEGIQSRYQIGEEVNVTCSFGPSKPAAELKWFINGKEAPGTFTTHYAPLPHHDEQHVSETRLNFVVDPSHLWQGAMSLQCLASINQIYSKSSEELIVGDETSGIEPQHLQHVPPGIEGPKITGDQPHYEPDDVVDVNCTSSKSHQIPELRWYINDQEVTPEYLVMYRPMVHHDGLVSSRLGLKFRVQEEHFKNEEMRLKCTTTLSRVINKSSVETVVGGSHRTSGLHVLENRGSVVSGDPSLHPMWILHLLALLRCVC